MTSAYRLNSAGKDRPMLVILQSGKEKGKIFKHGKNLKDVTNHDGLPYHVDNQFPGARGEAEIRKRQLLGKNRRLQGSANQLEMSIKKGKLYVDDQQYRKQVSRPTVCEQVNPEKPTFPVTKGSEI